MTQIGKLLHPCSLFNLGPGVVSLESTVAPIYQQQNCLKHLAKFYKNDAKGKRNKSSQFVSQAELKREQALQLSF